MSDPNLAGSEFFDRQAKRWKSLYERKPAFRDRLNLFLQEIQQRVKPGGTVLDVGCGPGVITLALAKLGYRMIGVDRAPNMVMISEKSRQEEKIDNARFSVMDGPRLAFGNDCVDGVMCSSLVEYIDDDVTFLREMVRVVRPGGCFLASVPHQASLLAKVEDASARISHLQKLQGRGYLSFLRRRYDRRSLLELLGEMSLEDFRCTYFEVPLLGNLGISFSRLSQVGLLMLVSAEKSKTSPHDLEDKPATVVTNGKRRALSRKNVWDSVPSPVKRVIGPAIRSLGKPLGLGRRYHDWKTFIRDSEFWDTERIRDYQLRHVREICVLAHEKSPYYQNLFSEIGFDPRDLKSLDDILALPLLNKETLRSRMSAVLAVHPSSRGVDYVSTGGTSGKPLGFYVGADRSNIEYACLVASWERVGYTIDTPQAILRGEVVKPNHRDLRHRYDPLLRRHYYSNFHTTDEDMGRYLDHISTIGPCYLHVYPSSITALARYIERAKIAAPTNIRGILAGSEMVYENDRVLAERVFGVRYFSWYGHSEKLVLAAECEHSTDYHVWPTYGYFELLDDQGNRVDTPGQRGEIVGTGFINRVVPFIRYRTGDFATYVGPGCEQCGRNHPIIRDILGHRTQEVLVAVDGSTISWTAVNMHDDTFQRVNRFQFSQSRPGFATLKILPAPGFGEEDRRRIHQNLNKKLTNRISFDIELVDTIALTSAGKCTFVDQKLDIERGMFAGVTGTTGVTNAKGATGGTGATGVTSQ
jgi:phenylacetate-coenzyme A ligase PaaK-like adenylate-forming protein/SAM-dependent methyltransferase